MLRAQNDANGIHIDAQTSKPGWLGERLSLGYAIDVLHPLATGEIGHAYGRAATVTSRPRLPLR